jgi:tetratricopeptide (TPR) repeat protein
VRSPRQLSILLLALSLALGGLVLSPQSSLVNEAQAQSRREQRKQKVLDYKAFEREKNREAYGELANQKRQEAIVQLKSILSQQERLPADTKAEMLMRLAELYFEQSKYEYNTEMQDYEGRYDRWFDLPEKQQKQQEEPKLVPGRSAAYTKKSIQNYQVILKNYPNYPRVDEALFFLAFMLNDLGQEKEALEKYQKLVKTFGRSTFVPDAHNAIGEYYFNNNNAFKALQAYKQAARFKDSKIYTFALYKMGWCYYNVGEFGTAIETMKELVSETDRRMRETGEAAGISLKEEALRDLVLFFSEEGDLQAAKEYFTRYGEKRYYRKMLARLGNIYIDQGKNSLAVQTYRELIADNPYASDNPEHQYSIIKAFWGRDKFDEANEEINKLVETYGRTSRWSQENKDNRTATKESERLIERNLRNVAIDSHQQAIKRRSAKLLLLAEENYGRYLDYFETGRKTYEIRYWHAEVLYKLKRYEQATDQYEAVVKSDAKGKFLKDAAGNAIFAIEQVLKPIKSKLAAAAKKAVRELKRSGTGVGKYAEIELHPWEDRLVTACDAYAKALPDNKKTLPFLYKAALLLHDRNHYNDSNPRFLQIIRSNPKSEMAQYGVHEILESYSRIENWTELNKAAREFYNNADIGKSRKFKVELRDIYQRATFKIAEGHASAAKHPEAATAFLDFYKEFGDSKVRDIALYNSGFYFGKTGNKRKMLELRHEFVDNFPKPLGKDAARAKLYEKSLAILGSHYQSIAAYDRSAHFFRILYDSENKFDQEGFATARDALYDSALYKEALGDIDGSIRDFRDYMSTWPGADDVLATRARIAKMLRKAGQTAKAQAAYKAIYSDKKVVAGAFEVAMEAHLAYGQMIGSREKKLSHYREGLRFFQKHSTAEGARPGAKSAAEMRFELLEPDFAGFASQSIPANTKKASGALKKKMEGVRGLEKKYVEVLNLKQGEWGIAALYRIGTLYGNFADTLRSAPCPEKLDEDQCSIYKFGLEDKAYPLVDKAVDAFTKAREKSYELGVYSSYTVKALEELSRLRPEEYPANAEHTPLPDYTSNPYTTADFHL